MKQWLAGKILNASVHREFLTRNNLLLRMIDQCERFVIYSILTTAQDLLTLSTESLSLFLKEWTVWLEVLVAHVGPHGFLGGRGLLAH